MSNKNNSNQRKRNIKNNKHQNRNNSPGKKKKELNDYLYYTGTHKQASDYERTTKFLINYIKGEFSYGNNIVESIRKGEYIDTSTWYPNLEINMATDPDKKKTKDIELQMKYKAKIDATMKRETTFESNKTKTYSLLWERCTLLMQGQIEQRKDFEIKLYNNPINLIKTIKEQTLDYQDARYEMEIIDNSLMNFLLTKQKDKELHKYTKRFKSSKQVLESHLGGPIKFTKYVSKMDKYNPVDDTKNSAIYLEAWENFSA